MEKEYIRILHLNDLHSHFESYPKVKRFFEEYSKTDAEVIKLDIGDNIDKSHPMTELTSGKINCQLMNELGIQFATIGNNEGIGLTKEELNQVYSDASFEMILCNLKDNVNQPIWAKEYVIYTTKNGTRLAILGATFPYTMAYEPNGWQIEDPISALKKTLCQKEVLEADCRILMSHLGLSVDKELTKIFKEIDVIIGSHTHHIFESGAVLNGTYMAAAGKFGQFVGEINLTFENHELRLAEMTAHETYYMASEQGDKQWIEDFLNKGRQGLSKEWIKSFDHELSLEESCDVVMKAMLEYGQADCVLLNTGLVVEAFPKEVTNDILHHSLPHQMRLAKISLTFLELVAIVKEVMKEANYLKSQEIRGMGFRGKIFGEMVFLGFDFRDGELHLDAKIDGDSPIDLMIVDQYYFAPYFERIREKEVELLFPELLRDVVRKYLKGEL